MRHNTTRRSTSSTHAARRSTSSSQAVSAQPSATRQGFGKGRPRYTAPVLPEPGTLNLGAFQLDTANKGDGLKLLKAMPDNAVKTAFFDPQYPGGVKNWEKLRTNKKLIHGRRAELNQMSEPLIKNFFDELSRVVAPSGHVFLWVDNYHVRNGIGHWLEGTDFEAVDMITWHKNRLGLGWRSRSSAEFLIVLQKRPKRVKGCWSRRNIPSVWSEKVNAKFHTHAKPMDLQMALIDATTEPGDLVLDPCSGSFSVMDAAHAMGRRFIGCDLDGGKRRPNIQPAQVLAHATPAPKKVIPVSPKRRAQVGPTPNKVVPVPLADTTAQPKAKPPIQAARRAKVKPVPKVSRVKRASAAVKVKRAVATEPVGLRKTIRKVVRKRSQVRKVLPGSMFVLVPVPTIFLNLLAAIKTQWSRQSTRRRSPQAQARAWALAVAA